MSSKNVSKEEDGSKPSFPRKLLRGAKEQLIDTSGKARALFYVVAEGEEAAVRGKRGDDEGRGQVDLMLITSPMAPRDLPVKSSQTECGEKELKAFISKYDLVVISKDMGEGDRVKGVWVRLGVSKSAPRSLRYQRFYIPTNIDLSGSRSFLSEVANAEPGDTNPLKTGFKDNLSTFRTLRRSANILQAYVLFTYSIFPKKFTSSPKNLLEIEGLKESKRRVYSYEKAVKNFVIEKDPNYEEILEELQNRLFYEGNDIIYSEGKIKVTSKLMRDKLCSYLESRLVRDYDAVSNFSQQHEVVPEAYSTITDFRSDNSQLVFTNINGIRRWIASISASREKPVLVGPAAISEFMNARFIKESRAKTMLPIAEYRKKIESEEPVVVALKDLRGKEVLALIQRVKEDELNRALAVAVEWKTSRRNPGYDVRPLRDEDPHREYEVVRLKDCIISDPKKHLVFRFDEKDPVKKGVNKKKKYAGLILL
jgi:hypothetical protein